jgi:ABC-type dipeptide/oligopeptide/nickel transport system permease component
MQYFIKKTIGLMITIFVVSILSFLAFEVLPGDPARTILGTQATESKVMALREEMGLNRPLPQRYAEWVKGMVCGDFGESYYYHTSVREMLSDKVMVTVVLTLLAFLWILLGGLFFGILSARYVGGWFDRVLTIWNQICMAVPPFFIGMLFTFFFGLTLHWFVPGGFVSYQEDAKAFLSYMILPSIAMAIPKIAMAVKFLRGSLLDEMKKEYGKTARSRGASENRVLLCHVLPNAVRPLITFLGMAVADMTVNSMIIEQVFGIPGLGRTLILSISKRDYPVVEALIVLVAVLMITMNFVVDLIYHKLDKQVQI